MPNLLLTGVTGFIGKHLLAAIEADDRFTAFTKVLLTSGQFPGYTVIEHKQYQFTRQDFIAQSITDIDVVIHAGAFTPKSMATANDQKGCFSNIESLKQLINELPSKPKRFIFLSTLDVYKPVENEIITEHSDTAPASLYGWSKLYGEKMLEAWAAENQVELQVLRIGHIYGRGEEQYQKIIPLTIQKVASKIQPVIFSKGLELRSFLHVSDCVRAILAAVFLPAVQGPINLVSAKAVSVLEIVKMIVQAIDPAIGIEIQGKDLPVRNLVFDATKMNTYLAYEEITLQAGIEDEIQYMTQHA